MLDESACTPVAETRVFFNKFLEQLLFRRVTSLSAMRCLALLTGEETEQWSNNSTGVFTECFHPFHPQLPLELPQRLVVLRELLGNDAPKQRKTLALKAADAAFNRTGAVTLRQSEGADPFDAVPVFTYGELRDYFNAIIGQVRPLMGDPDPQVAKKAGEVLMTGIGEYAIQADSDSGIELLEEIGPMVFEGTVPIAIESFVSTLKHVSRTFSGHESVAVAASRIDALLRGLDTAAFSVRLKRWVGSWEFGDEELDSDGVRLFRGEIEIRRLAKAGAEDPTLVTPALLEWLVSPEAKRSYDFFYRLGQLDSDWRWQSMVENMGESDAGARAFSCYFGGRASQRPAEVEDRLDHFAASGLVRASAIVDATGFLPGSMRAIRRVLKLLNEGGVEAVSVERRLMGGGWMTPINSDEAAVLMQGIAGEDFSGAALVIDFLAMWVHHNKPIDGQLAEVVWRALDTAPEGGEAWDYDRVAAAIAGTNIDRAFDLLFMYLTLPHNRQSWEPLDRHGGNRFWNFLWQANPQRCIDVLLRAKTASPLFSWRIGWHLPEILDLVRDHEVLLAFAQQGEANAEFVASCLSSKEGFWPLALSILAFHPENENIRRYVTGAVQHTNRVTIGPASERYRVWADELEAQAASASTPDTVRPFLRDLSEQLLRRSQDERRSEADEQVNW